MLNELKQKIIVDLLVTPTTLITAGSGITVFGVSWALNAGVFWMFGGFSLLLASGLTIATNFIFNLDSISEKAMLALAKQQRQVNDDELDKLYEKLCTDDDHRDNTYLRDMRVLYDKFLEDVNKENLSEFVTPEMISQVDALFAACKRLLIYQYELWQNSLGVNVRLRKKMDKEREKIITEIGKSVEKMADAINGIRSLSVKSGETDLERLRDDLEVSMRVARRTEERMRNFDRPSTSCDSLGE